MGIPLPRQVVTIYFRFFTIINRNCSRFSSITTVYSSKRYAYKTFQWFTKIVIKYFVNFAQWWRTVAQFHLNPRIFDWASNEYHPTKFTWIDSLRLHFTDWKNWRQSGWTYQKPSVKNVSRTGSLQPPLWKGQYRLRRKTLHLTFSSKVLKC